MLTTKKNAQVSAGKKASKDKAGAVKASGAADIVKETAAASKPKKIAAATKPKITKKEEKNNFEIKIERVKKVLYVASEAAPYIASGGLADVAGSLPAALKNSCGFDIRVVIPLYSSMKRDKSCLKFVGSIYIPLGWRNQYCGVFTEKKNGVIYYFIDNEYYFKRAMMYGDFDDAERFAFFSKSVLEIMPLIDFYPDIIHSNDWHSALVPVYLKTIFAARPNYSNIKSVFTIHNIEYQGVFSKDIAGDVFGIPESFMYLLEYGGAINLMKAAIECSEHFTTVSPKYAKEIHDSFYAHGLESIIKRNNFKLTGILNGIDTETYNSLTDKTLFKNFSSSDISGKAVCKSELQKMLNLPVRPNIPVLAMITRLVSHKGLDLMEQVIEDILKEDLQLVILGTGESRYENFFADTAHRYSGKMSVILAFNSDLARKIYSGSDLFLMPSKSEPCGLSQMISSRYGSVPIVRETGGLFDSIKPVGSGGNGFTFASYNAHDMLYVIKEALAFYQNIPEFSKLVKTAMDYDFSWEKSAKKYAALYGGLMQEE